MLKQDFSGDCDDDLDHTDSESSGSSFELDTLSNDSETGRKEGSLGAYVAC